MKKKKAFIFACLACLLLCSTLLLFIPGNQITAQIPVNLPTEDPGWKRLDDKDTHITYEGTHYNDDGNGSCYNSTTTHINGDGAIKFSFTGDKIRILAAVHPSLCSAAVSVNIDGTFYNPFSSQIYPENQGCMLVFEATECVK